MFSRGYHAEAKHAYPIWTSGTMLRQNRLLAVISKEADCVPFPCFVTVNVVNSI